MAVAGWRWVVNISDLGPSHADFLRILDEAVIVGLGRVDDRYKKPLMSDRSAYERMMKLRASLKGYQDLAAYILRELDAGEVAALISAWQLGGGVGAYVWLQERFREPEDDDDELLFIPARYVRLNPHGTTDRMTMLYAVPGSEEPRSVIFIKEVGWHRVPRFLAAVCMTETVSELANSTNAVSTFDVAMDIPEGIHVADLMPKRMKHDPLIERGKGG